MDIKYLGHSSFKLRGKDASLVTDPFDPKLVGLDYGKVSAEVITLSHDHADHNASSRVTGTTKREIPFVVDSPGEFEASGIGVIAISSFHDDKQGADRGKNLICVIQVDGLVVAHMGDLGHVLSDKQVSRIGPVDILFLPVGGSYTIGPVVAIKVIDQLSPSIVIPMHYKVEGMSSSFDGLVTVDEFLDKGGFENVRTEEKLSVSSSSLPEETEVVVLKV